MLDTVHDLGSTLGRVPSVDHVTLGKRSKLQQGLLWGRKELQMFKLGLEKAEEPEIKLPTSAGSWKKQEFQKNIYFCFIDYAKAFDRVDHSKLENSSRNGNTRPPYLPPEKYVCRSRSNS